MFGSGVFWFLYVHTSSSWNHSTMQNTIPGAPLSQIMNNWWTRQIYLVGLDWEGLSCGLRYTVIGCHLSLLLMTGEVWEITNKQRKHVSKAGRRVWLLSCFRLFVPSDKQEIFTFYEIGDLGRRRPRRMKMGGRSLIWQNWQLREIGSSAQLTSGGILPDEASPLHEIPSLILSSLHLIECSSFRYVYEIFSSSCYASDRLAKFIRHY